MKNSSKEFKKIKGLLWTITFIYAIWIFFIGDIKKTYLLIHVILAWVPLQISILIKELSYKCKKKKYLKLVIGLLSILWLMFYPKSLYMLTDFIYISDKSYFNKLKYVSYIAILEPKIIINSSFSLWIDLATIVIGIFLGYTLGFLSLYINQYTIEKKFGNIVAWIFVIIVNIMSGFSIYVDRFFNIDSLLINFGIYKMIYVVQNYFNAKFIAYTLIFGFFILMMYFITYLIVNIKPLLNS